MPKLILIKHATPQVVSGISPEHWVLSFEGQKRCGPLADLIAPYAPAAIVTSDEAKAIETGKIIAAKLSIPVSTARGLHEHDRSNVPQMRSGQFISMIELAFRKPKELVLGKETIAQATKRLDIAISAQIVAHTGKSLAIVTHGTILAQWLANKTGEIPFEVWRKMGLPSFAVIDLETMQVFNRVDQVQAQI